jgi:hypothetical protein
MGGIAFFVVLIIEKIGGFNSRTFEMTAFGGVSYIAWNSKKAKLASKHDLVVWGNAVSLNKSTGPFAESSLENGLPTP